PQPPLVATDVVLTRPVPGMQMSAAYLSLTNNSDETIRISRVVSAQYGSVQLHESIVKDGIARMRAIPVLEIPAGETITLKRGGKHLMLMRPTGAADSVSLQLLDGDNLVLAVDASFEPTTTR
ncbi:MAG: copper chaperone PCu(A)C, partial [Woeseiaceae bacterium]